MKAQEVLTASFDPIVVFLVNVAIVAVSGVYLYFRLRRQAPEKEKVH